MADSATNRKCFGLVTLGLDQHSLAQIRLFANTIPIAQLRAEFPQYASDDNLKFSEQPAVCVIDFDHDPEVASRVVERIRGLYPDTAVLATSWGSEADSIVRAMQCGCSDYLLKPLDQHVVLQAFSRLTRERDSADRSKGRVISFIGAKGGCGTTMLAVHLAELLARLHGRRILLIDHHPDLGDVPLYLGLDQHGYHFRDLLENTHRLDAQLVQGFVVRHSSGLDVLSAPSSRLEANHHVLPEAVQHAFAFLRSRYQFVLVDSPPGLAADNMVVARESDQIYLVATPELPALQHAVTCLGVLRGLCHGGDRVHVVINRDSTTQSAPMADRAEELLGTWIEWRIPNQYHAVMRTLNLGTPLRSSSEVARRLSRWAAALAEERPPALWRAENTKCDAVPSLRTAGCG